MKKYIGVKEVLAEPMNECDAVEQGIARSNSDNHEWRHGYKVVYEDGYTSWSPENVFTKAYKIANTPLDRVNIEIDNLSDKIEKLFAFTKTDTFIHKLNGFERELMYKQFNLMTEYRQCLIERKRLMKE